MSDHNFKPFMMDTTANEQEIERFLAQTAQDCKMTLEDSQALTLKDKSERQSMTNTMNMNVLQNISELPGGGYIQLDDKEKKISDHLQEEESTESDGDKGQSAPSMIQMGSTNALQMINSEENIVQPSKLALREPLSPFPLDLFSWGLGDSQEISPRG